MNTAGDGERRGFGLLGMSEHVRILGGPQTIQSAPGQGTTIIVNLNFSAARDARKEGR